MNAPDLSPREAKMVDEMAADPFVAWLNSEQEKYPRTDYGAWCSYFAGAWQRHQYETIRSLGAGEG